MRFQVPNRTLLVAISLAVVAGCMETTGPSSRHARYVLVQIGGDALPTFTGTYPGGYRIISDTLVFLPEDSQSGQVEHHQTIQYSAPPVSSMYVEFYSWHSGVLTFRWPPCPPNANCTSNFGQPTSETGRFGPGTLTITDTNTLVRSRTYRLD